MLKSEGKGDGISGKKTGTCSAKPDIFGVIVHAPPQLFTLSLSTYPSPATFINKGAAICAEHLETLPPTMSDDPMADFLAREKAALGGCPSHPPHCRQPRSEYNATGISQH